jgi:hypothetical protein
VPRDTRHTGRTARDTTPVTTLLAPLTVPHDTPSQSPSPHALDAVAVAPHQLVSAALLAVVMVL